MKLKRQTPLGGLNSSNDPRVPVVAQPLVSVNPTSICEGAGLIPAVAHWVKDQVVYVTDVAQILTVV